MRIFESLDMVEKFPNPVLTVGNYDGIHRGHKLIIERVKQRAREMNGTAMLMTFSPHPLHLLKPDKEVPSITTLAQKTRLIEESGIDVLIVVPFTAELSLIPAEAFVEEILVARFAIKRLVIGYDFRFGRGSEGDVEMLKRLAHTYGFFVEVVGKVAQEGEKVGSNRIRQVVQEGDMEKASRLLGRPYVIEGRVVSGEGRGKILGFPTVNLDPVNSLIPKNGVYVTEVEAEGLRQGSVTNIGHNPTFGGQAKSIETHIIDFQGDLYGKQISLSFQKRLRDERKFANVEELKAQIAQDVETARAYFSTRSTSGECGMRSGREGSQAK